MNTKVTIEKKDDGLVCVGDMKKKQTYISPPGLLFMKCDTDSGIQDLTAGLSWVVCLDTGRIHAVYREVYRRLACTEITAREAT